MSILANCPCSICLPILIVLVSNQALASPDTDLQLKMLEDILSNSYSQNISNSSVDDEFMGQHLETELGLILASFESQLLAANQAQEFFTKASKFGLPSFDNLKFRKNYILSYDNRLKHPTWVLESFTGKLRKNNAKEKYRYIFQPDLTLHEYFRTNYDEYRHTGYDRGHLAATCNSMASQELTDEVFVLSNIAPQLATLNAGACPWTRSESYVHYLAQKSRNLYIVSGTMYLPTSGTFSGRSDKSELMIHRLISERRIAVPTHYYKVLLTENYHGQFTMEAFVFPNSQDINKTARLEQFKIDISKQLPEMEKAIGLKFFDRIDRKRVIKSHKMQYQFGHRRA